MPSDELRNRAMEAIRERREAYHSALCTAVDEVRAVLDSQSMPENGRGERALAELGQFAAGRIDTDRFASLFTTREKLDRGAIERVSEALETLNGLLEVGQAVHRCEVPKGGDLRTEVMTALGEAGRAFAAGRTVEAVRTGNQSGIMDHTRPFPPTRWSSTERTLAPPLVVTLYGQDLRPAGLADFLEGGQMIVLLVRDLAPPAALARLVAPGVLVAQSCDPDVVELLKGRDGPAAVAVMPGGAAEFTWAPERDGTGELVVETWPEAEPRAIVGLSARRQKSDVELLRLLEPAAAGRVVDAAGAVAEKEEVEPTDKLAAWLLRQATIPEPGEV